MTTRKYFIAAAVALSIAGTGASVRGAQALELSAQINPLYEQYLTDAEEGRGEDWKIIPQKYIVAGEGDNLIQTFGAGNDSSPASYSLIDDDLVTGIKNQGGEGLCWAYSMTTAIESNLLKTKNITADLSPKKLDYLTANNAGGTGISGTYAQYINEKFEISTKEQRKLADGSNFALASVAMSGPYALSSENSFFAAMKKNNSNLADKPSYRLINDNYSMFSFAAPDFSDYYEAAMDLGDVEMLGDYIVTDYDLLVGESSTALVQKIKNHIFAYGAVAVTSFAPNSSTACWDDSSETIIDRGVTICGNDNGHAMTIIGWDDEHEYIDPSDSQTKTGAFLVQNSWGNSSLYEDYGVDADGLLSKLDTSGKSAEQIAALRAVLETWIEEYDANEYVWLGYEFSGESITFYAPKQTLASDTWDYVYDGLDLHLNQTASTGNILQYDLDADLSTNAYLADVAIKNVAIPANYAFDYTVYARGSNTEEWSKIGTTTMDANTMGQSLLSVEEPIAISDNLSIKVEVTYGNYSVDLSNVQPYFETVAYATDNTIIQPESEEDLPIPDTSESKILAPNTGHSTGTLGGVIGASLAGISVAAIAWYITRYARNRAKHHVDFKKH